MSNITYKKDCKYYDFADTVPSAYGAFCKLKKCCIQNANCKECKSFESREKE